MFLFSDTNGRFGAQAATKGSIEKKAPLNLQPTP